MGGFVSQEAIKAITQKFTPNHQLFFYDATEMMPELKVVDDILPLLEKHKNLEELEKAFHEAWISKNGNFLPLKNDRNDGLRIVVGDDLVDKL